MEFVRDDREMPDSVHPGRIRHGKGPSMTSSASGRSASSSPNLDTRTPSPYAGWLVHPVFDLVLVANVLWPLLIWLGTIDGFAGREGLLFWQVYFVTTPHRWITLLLVFGDRQRFRSRRWLFVGIAVVVVAVTFGVRIGTGSLTCLLALDYLWNAWHFSAQHHGVARLYTRRSGSQFVEPIWEKWAFRLFLLYVIFRVAGTTWSTTSLEHALAWFDFVVLSVPIVLLARAARSPFAVSGGGFVYRASVCGLFLGMLWAVHEKQPATVLAFATASALFHATEYLAVVGWTLQSKRDSDMSPLGLVGWIIPRWVFLITVFMMALGASGYWLNQHWLETWLTVNIAGRFSRRAERGTKRSPSMCWAKNC